jgi:hypothetical protein
MKFFVAGAGLTFVDQQSRARMISHGVIFDTGAESVPSGWTPPPDSTLLWPMDSQAQSALQASVNAMRAAIGANTPCPPGIGGLSANIPIWSP